MYIYIAFFPRRNDFGDLVPGDYDHEIRGPYKHERDARLALVAEYNATGKTEHFSEPIRLTRFDPECREYADVMSYDPAVDL